MAKYAAAEAALAALDAAIQTHGGNGMASEYGLAHLWGMARLLRIAPVSREMVLNYVAQHTPRPTPLLLSDRGCRRCAAPTIRARRSPDSTARA